MDKAGRLNKIEEVIRSLRFQHGVQKGSLDIEPDKSLGYKSRTATRFCSDPIEEWTCPLCMREFNGYGRSIVFPCWLCRDTKSLKSFGSLWQADLPEPTWSLSFAEADALDRLHDQEREQRYKRWEHMELRVYDRQLLTLRKKGGATRGQIEKILNAKAQIKADYAAIRGKGK